MGLPPRFLERFHAHRGRIARLVAVVGVLVVLAQFLPAIPREVQLRYDLGPAHATVQGLELVYQAGDEDLASARFGFGEEGPRLVEHSVRLTPGSYDVRATLHTPAGPLRFIRHFEAPADGLVRLELFDVALAQGPAPVPVSSRQRAESDSFSNVPSLAPPHGGVSLALRSVFFGRTRVSLPPQHRATQRHRTEGQGIPARCRHRAD
ncbi:MAG: hypothetical protein KC593_09545 [Myxococcales bacterium]|nr:hypothetical protein [Myxococcales bacterium]MCB9628487.1 hypothetical protein [Sandaracinaceae bacterium]